MKRERDPHKEEQTLVILKPDAIQRSLMGEILGRYERSGLKIVAMKMVIPTEKMAKDHYMIGGEEWLETVGRKAAAAYEKKGMKSPYATFRENGVAILEANTQYLSAGPVLALILEGHQAVAITRKITGGTEPLGSDVGTIRGDLTIDSYQLADVDSRSIRNLLHASGTPDEAQKEIPIWFTPEEILSYRHIQDAILYDVNLDGIIE